jgi:hypothetical protein
MGCRTNSYIFLYSITGVNLCFRKCVQCKGLTAERLGINTGYNSKPTQRKHVIAARRKFFDTLEKPSRNRRLAETWCSHGEDGQRSKFLLATLFVYLLHKVVLISCNFMLSRGSFAWPRHALRSGVAARRHARTKVSDWNKCVFIYFIIVRSACFWRDSSHWARAPSFLMFLDHTQRLITVGRTPLDEWSARPEESYRLCCVLVCDLETSRIRVPYIYIYDISSPRVNDLTLILLTWRKWWANNASK